ncbi:hypothetical protein GPECTOR_25g315 [Gonium pectorale]|uniref:RBR-type E3 ubiquitin transferase n=1 Tax=Gonium pectorale TaxID=33097 RepID=A0A150GFV7_GONPE|nr:hypothetical protein GPECTOR_25g315 [Gonium pectorale]|eukprot:KXZ48731.1 hypothetical protein GPECTOR_25g315 [Gonium pectorale]
MARLDPDTWLNQLEELMAMQAVLDDDFSLLKAPGAPLDEAEAAAGGANGERWLDPEALLIAGPPPDLCDDGAGGDGSVDLFVAEALVHVEVPETGLQLMVEAPPPVPPPRPQQPPHQLEHKEESAAGRGDSPPAGNRASSDGGSGGARASGHGSGGPTANGGRGGGPGHNADGRQDPIAGAGAAAGPAAAPAPGGYATPRCLGPPVEEAPVAAATPPTLVPFGPPVAFLSPIRVTLTLPHGYPAACPPAVSLHAPWLSGPQAEALAAGLAGVWEAQGPGGPIALVWVDWLRGEALRHLAITDALVLRRGEAAATPLGAGVPARAAVDAAGPEVLAVSLLRYSAAREQEKFNESNVRCPICFEEHLGSRCVRLPECRHAFCGGCLATHLRTQLRDGAVDRLACPEPGCRRQLAPYVLQQMLGQEEYARWEQLTLQRTLDKMEDLVYCPRCREPCLEDPDHSVLCPSCFYSFCALCEDSWHPGSSCLNAADRLALLEARRQRAGDAGDGRSATERARQQVNRMNELKSLALLSATTKQCPVCSMGVEKTEGCNKMTCGYCGSFFCWKCSRVISGYDHFQQPAGQPGGCVLFDQEEIDRWNARWNGGVVAPRVVQVEQHAMIANYLGRFGARMCRCVVCGQPNAKEGGNNCIRCWSCNGHFCYLCRTWLRNRPGQHFGTGPGRCRQHTDD